MFNYVVTANKPTAVTHSVVGNFTSPIDINLIIWFVKAIAFSFAVNRRELKFTLLLQLGFNPFLMLAFMDELLLLNCIGLMYILFDIFIIVQKGEPQDWLLVLTERYKFFVLAYDSKTGEIITKANGDVGVFLFIPEFLIEVPYWKTCRYWTNSHGRP